jgi:anti-sigma factor RsiW
MAYADGLLPADRKARVAAHLARDPDAAALVAEWRAQTAALDRLFPADEAEARTRALSRAIAGGSRPAAAARPWLGQALAASIFLALGGVGGWMLHGTTAPGRIDATALVDDAIAAHRLYTAEVLHPVEVGAASEAHLVGWLSKRLGATLRVPDLGSAGYTLVGGRLLPGETGAAAQFMYEDADGNRLTVYAMAGPTGQLAAFQYREQGGLGGVYWQDQTLRYAVIAALPRDGLTGIATEIYRQLI